MNHKMLDWKLEHRTTPHHSIRLKISHTYFVPDAMYKACINEYSNRVDRLYDCFSSTGITFFKVLGLNSTNFEAKLVRGDVLYTKIRYLIVKQNAYVVPNDFFLPKDITLENSFRFDSMAGVIVINKKTIEAENYCHKHNYELDSSESLAVLWPPLFTKDESYCTTQDAVYLHTSFELQAHGNINLHSRGFTAFGSGLYKVELESKVKIYKKNAEMAIKKVQEEDTQCTDSNVEVMKAVFSSSKNLIKRRKRFMYWLLLTYESNIVPGQRNPVFSLVENTGIIYRNLSFMRYDVSIYTR